MTRETRIQQKRDNEMLRIVCVVSTLIALAIASEARTAEQEGVGRLAKASALIGRNVVNTENAILGEVYDLVVDPDGKRVSHLVLAEGGILGIGATLRPVPIEAAELRISTRTPEVSPPTPTPPAPAAPAATQPAQREWVFEIDVSEEQFQKAPTLEDDWSVLDDPEWAANLDAFYGLEDVQRHQERQSCRVSGLTGIRVRDRTHEHDLGNLREIVFEVETGHIRYGALSYGGLLGFGETLVAVPWEAFELQEIEGRDEYHLVLNATEEQIQGAAGFDHDDWPNVADPELTDELATHRGTERRLPRGEVDVRVGPGGVDVEVEVRPRTREGNRQ